MTLNSIADFLALRRNTTLLLVALMLAGTGERLWLGFAPKYLETLGATVLVIGLFDALQTLLGFLFFICFLGLALVTPVWQHHIGVFVLLFRPQHLSALHHRALSCDG
jgi:hypothetical protein